MIILIVFSTIFVGSLSENLSFKTDTRLIVDPQNQFFIFCPNGGWLDIVELLRKVDKEKLSSLMKGHQNLLIDDSRLAHRILTSVIRHSMIYLADKQLQMQLITFIEKAAILNLKKSLRMLRDSEIYSPDNCCKDDTNIIVRNFLTDEFLGTLMENNLELSPVINALRDSVIGGMIEAVIANQELEYIDLSLSDARMAHFLKEVNLLIDGGDLKSDPFISKITTIKKEENYRLPLKDPDIGILEFIKHPLKITPVIKDYLPCFTNRHTSFFIQFMVARHCKQHHLSQVLKQTEGAYEVLMEARELKLSDFEEKVEKIIESSRSSYLKLFDHEEEGSPPETGIDLRNDNVFSSIRQYFTTLGEDDISRIEDAISMWLDERVQLTIIRPEFKYFFKTVFEIIDTGELDMNVQTILQSIQYKMS